MRLKTIEVKGFKSFAEKTIINFSEPVIGVVGSNGCGKSNIVDAVRWVLGEQKTSALRSDSMTNVIFNGTKTKPAAGLAEVTLVFENHKGILPTEYQEVAIRRVLYKDGAGEYYLNQVRCRLKDIHTLLQNTGISSDSYAIIALSMVDDLLQDKENARLALFEQAAGIAGYKGKKKETLSKLKNVDEDLARIEDLRAEIEKNLQSLEKQAARTRKYLDLKHEYKELALELVRFQAEDYKTQYRKSETQIKEQETRNADTLTSIEATEKKLREARSLSAEGEQRYQHLQNQLNQTTGKLKAKENEQKMLTQKTWFLQDGQQKLQLQIEEADTRTTQYRARIEQLQTQIEGEQEILAAQKAHFQSLQTQYAEQNELLKSVKEASGAQDRKLQEQQRTSFELEKQIAISKSKIEQAEQQISRLQQQNAEHEGQQRSLQTQLQQADFQIQESQKRLQEEKEMEADTLAQIADNQALIESEREQLSQYNRQYDAAQNEYKLLRSLVESLEGYSESVKFLGKNASWSGEQAPVLFSDLIYCPAEYRTAVENYLEPYLSYYVVPNTREALQAIRLLDEHQKGKANFFVISEIPADSELNAAAAAPAQARAAIEIVQFDPQYAGLMRQLLQNVYIVPTSAELPASIGKEQVFITQDGKFAQKAFFMRGGSTLAFEGKKIGRKKNLELLQAQIQELSAQTETSRTRLKNLQQLLAQLQSQPHRRNIQQIEQQLQQHQRAHLLAKSRLDGFIQQQQQNDEDSQEQEKLLRLSRRSLEHTQQQYNILRVEMQQDSQQQTQQQNQLQQQQQRLQELQTLLNEQNIQTLRQQNSVQALEKEIHFTRQQIDDTSARLEQDRSKTSTSAEELIETERQIAQIQMQLQDLYEDRKRQQQILEESEKQFFAKRGDIGQTEERLQQLNRQYQTDLQLLGQLQNAFSQTKLQLSALAERVRIEFELNINDVLRQDPDRELFQQEELSERVEKLRLRLHNFGAVNYMAVEAYDETKTRFDFISSQREDLINAKNTLLSTLQEIEGAATERFMEAFTATRTHFISVFRSLFEADDTCDLLLSNPTVPLESRIEIVAKPKGKKPLSINQLSGGEKTLTATALLFALYLLKPAPFCIFDEVDAPLDDANIAKFNHIIRDFSANSQFIVVTHNKKTMEAVNILYGVTMVDGISRVVPVDFRTYEI